jgi:hypothetical protein
MKLKSAVFVNALRVAFSQLKITMSAAEYQQMTAKLETGNFVNLFQLVDEVGFSDATAAAFFKTLTDNADAVDVATLAFGRALQDTGHVEDTTLLLYSKSAFDVASVTDVFVRSIGYGRSFLNSATAQEITAIELQRSLDNSLSVTDEILAYISGKQYYDTPVATDEINSFAVNKLFLDTATATDDLDGTATPLDDQEIQFVKVRTDVATFSDFVALVKSSFRLFSDAATAIDDNFFSFGKRPSDTASATDAGSLRSHNYSDFTYFSEDFVGASRTFT